MASKTTGKQRVAGTTKHVLAAASTEHPFLGPKGSFVRSSSRTIGALEAGLLEDSDVEAIDNDEFSIIETACEDTEAFDSA